MNNEVNISISTVDSNVSLNTNVINEIINGKWFDTNDISFSVGCFGANLDISFVSSTAVVLSSALNEIDVKKCILDYYSAIKSKPIDTYQLDINSIFYKDGSIILLPSLVYNNEYVTVNQALQAFVDYLYNNSKANRKNLKRLLEHFENSNSGSENMESVIEDAFAPRKVEVIKKRVCPNCHQEFVEDYLLCVFCGSLLETIEIVENDDELEDEEDVEEVIETESAPEPQEIEEEIEEEAEENEIEETELEVEESDEKIEETEEEQQEESSNDNESTEDELVFDNDADENESEESEEKSSSLSVPVKKKKKVIRAVKHDIPQPVEEHNEEVKEEETRGNNSSGGINPLTSDYTGTTLLGFSSGGENKSLDTPNLVRLSNNDKVYISKRNFVVGKNAENDYVIDDNSAISRVHAEIRVIDQNYYVVDNGSTNHTYVNGQMIQPNTATQIFDGDEIKFANEEFKFYLQ